MVSVKLLKPYYIKMNSEYIRIILAYQYFSLFINKKVYHFVPIEGQEILVNRRTKKVVNTETKFAFQKGKDVIYIKMNSEYIRIILAYQYFSLFINKKVYHFVPIEGQEILVNRRTKKVVNTETKFAFQKGKDVIYITMKKLTSLVDFMDQLEEII